MLNHHRLMRSIVVAAVSALVASVTYAAGTTFELENKSSANIKDDIPAVGPDWASLFDVPGPELASPPTGTDGVTPTPKASLPTGVFKAGFFRDFLIGQTSDATTFTTGTKDIQNISGGGVVSGEWQCKKKSNLSDKGDLLNAYAAIYEHTNGNIMLAMGIERASDNGTSKVGFWFLQDDSVACDTTSGKAQTSLNRVATIPQPRFSSGRAMPRQAASCRSQPEASVQQARRLRARRPTRHRRCCTARETRPG
jgi:hypothetical protein